MKKILLVLPFVIFGLFCVAQCDKSVAFKCYKGRVISNGSAEQDMPVEVIMSIDKGKLNVSMTFDRQTAMVEGEITEVVTCEWTEYLQNGKAQYKANVNKEGRGMEAAIIEIESYNGQTKITFSSSPDDGSKLQLDVTDYTIAAENLPTPRPAASQPVKRKKKG